MSSINELGVSIKVDIIFLRFGEGLAKTSLGEFVSENGLAFEVFLTTVFVFSKGDISLSNQLLNLSNFWRFVSWSSLFYIIFFNAFVLFVILQS